MWRWGGNWCLREEPSVQREQLSAKALRHEFSWPIESSVRGGQCGWSREREGAWWCRGCGSCHRAWWALLKTVPSGDGKPLEGIESRSEIVCSSILRASLLPAGWRTGCRESRAEAGASGQRILLLISILVALRADIQTSYWWRTNIQHRNRV